MSRKDDGSDPAGELILYQTEDGRTRIECRFDRGSIWLTQNLLAELYQTSIPNIVQHIRNILREGEVDPSATTKDYLVVRREGAREVRRAVKHYSLEMILAVGYRVRSERGTVFRQWATARLSEFWRRTAQAPRGSRSMWQGPATLASPAVSSSSRSAR